MEQVERWKLGETFRNRVSDDPNALVKPEILGTEALGMRGRQTPLKIVREVRLCQNLS